MLDYNRNLTQTVKALSGERDCYRETQVQLSLHQCISIEVHCIVVQAQFSVQFLYIINHKLIKRENMVMLTRKTFTVGFKTRTMHNLLLKSAFSIGKQQQPTFNPNKLAWRVWKPSTVFLDRKRTLPLAVVLWELLCSHFSSDLVFPVQLSAHRLLTEKASFLQL